MIVSAWDLAASEVDAGHPGGQNRRAESPRHTVHEHCACRDLGTYLADADDGRVMDFELHRRFGAALVIVAVRAQAIGARGKVERQALRAAAVLAAGRETQIAAADETVERLSPRIRGPEQRRHCHEERKHD